MRRILLTATAVLALAAFGCARSHDEGPKEVPISEDDSYEMAIFAEQRAEWEPLAEKGDATAQKNLGMMFYLGQGMAQDFDEARKWMEKAAAQGEDVAQLTLGVMYMEGQGVPQDKVQALKWLVLSQEQGNPSADTRAKEMVESMTEEQVKQGRELAANWQPGQ